MGVGSMVVFLAGVAILCSLVRYGRCWFRLVWTLFGSLLALAAWAFVSGHLRV
jgi:hypothetical protein